MSQQTARPCPTAPPSPSLAGSPAFTPGARLRLPSPARLLPAFCLLKPGVQN